MKQQYIYLGRPVSYSLHGKGQKLILLHGFGETASVWREIVNDLSKDYEVLVPDIPGSGDSPAIDDMTMDGLATAVHALASSLGWKKYVLIGHSMGGYISLAYADLFPAALNALGLFHSTAYADSEEKISTRKKGIQFIKDNGAAAFLRSTTANLFAPETKKQRPELIDRIVASGTGFSEEVLISYYEGMIQRPDRTHILSQVPYPVLIIMGKYDQAVPVKDNLQLCKLPKVAYIHTLFQSGHMGMLEETQRSISILRQFMADLSQ